MMNKDEIRTAMSSLVTELAGLRGGKKVKLIYTVSGTYQNLSSSCFIYRPNLHGDPEGLITPLQTSEEALMISEYLRDLSYVSDAGTWFTMEITIEADGQAHINFDFEKQPFQYGEVSNRHNYMKELYKYPTSEANMKAWFKNGLKYDSIKL